MANENVINRKAVELTLRDDRTYVVKPLTINELIEIWPIIQRLESKSKNIDKTLLEDMKQLAHAALKDQLNKDTDVGDLVDMVDINKLILAIVGQNEDSLKALMQQSK